MNTTTAERPTAPSSSSTRRSWPAGVRQGVPASLAALAPALTVVFARVFAAVFEPPFLRHRSWPQDAGQQHPRAEAAPG